ncbi:MAG: enoyl-CoA hydratase/isomerase family protein [Gammaproteobacteria bacterium]|nr:MAG: enoyl-CoA hydratase/isomerase family protein [Gammaproteobacteria bacterium]RLA33750.1 MAG: enoyl-CoA hydratase/isomerase family protein [Gammaproteobacteria bacterium]
MSKILFQKRGVIGEIKLNRPDKLNAIDSEMLDGLDAALDNAAADDDIRVLLLSGEGRAFSAGFDLDTGSAAANESQVEFMRRELQRDFDLIMRFWDFPKPIVAAVHGYCLGSSMEITAVCDITIAAEGTRFGAPEVRYGSGIVCMILPWIIGQKNARELLLTGSDKIDAHRAESIGLVNRVVAADSFLQEARSVAEEIALNDPLAVRLTKKAINRSVEIAGLRQALDEALEVDIEIESTETAESKEFARILASDGPKAALQWRAAKLPGK